MIQDTASTATLVALITARDRRMAGFGEYFAAPLDRLVVYTSEEANSSVPKGARLAGYHPDRIRLIETDEDAALSVPALRRAIEQDRASGLVPAAVVATVGTTGSTAIDPVPALAEVCQSEGMWLHVDAAFAGSAAVLPEMRWILAGTERADSLVFNPHKWLLVNFDCSAYFVRDRAALLRSFSASAEILKSGQDDRVANFRDWGIQLGRRFRALKLWFVIRSYGVEGLQAMLREHIRLGRRFAEWVDQDPGFERIGPADLATVCFRLAAPAGGEAVANDPAQLDRLNRELLARINASGRVFLTGTRLKGRFVLRMSLGHLASTEEHLSQAWALIRQSAGTGAG